MATSATLVFAGLTFALIVGALTLIGFLLRRRASARPQPPSGDTTTAHVADLGGADDIGYGKDGAAGPVTATPLTHRSRKTRVSA